MQNIPAGLIPYNHELYLTGKYIAETRGGFRPEIVYNNHLCSMPVVYPDRHKIGIHCYENGQWFFDRFSDNDLFLRPKTVKKYHPVFKDMLFDSEEECIKNLGKTHYYLKAVEVEVNED